jgi:hypothetical protein
MSLNPSQLTSRTPLAAQLISITMRSRAAYIIEAGIKPNNININGRITSNTTSSESRLSA